MNSDINHSNGTNKNKDSNNYENNSVPPNKYIKKKNIISRVKHETKKPKDNFNSSNDSDTNNSNNGGNNDKKSSPLKMKITFDTLITQEIRCSNLSISFSKSSTNGYPLIKKIGKQETY